MADTDQAELAAVKRYMRIEGTDEDSVIKPLLAAAKLYLKNAGVEAPTADADLYNLAVWSLTNHYYDHRDDVGSEPGIPQGLRPILTQLKLTAMGG